MRFCYLKKLIDSRHTRSIYQLWKRICVQTRTRMTLNLSWSVNCVQDSYFWFFENERNTDIFEHAITSVVITRCCHGLWILLSDRTSYQHFSRTLPWWRHQVVTFSALLAICAGNSPITGEFPTQGPVTRGFDVFFDLHLNKRLSKQSWGWSFETLSRPLLRHRNAQTGIKLTAPYRYEIWQYCWWESCQISWLNAPHGLCRINVYIDPNYIIRNSTWQSASA